MLLNEIVDVRAHYVGNCVNSFDEDGECDVRELPWNDTTEFAQAIEETTPLTKEQFMQQVSVPNEINIEGMQLAKTEDGVYVAYDDNQDIHYFFT